MTGDEVYTWEVSGLFLCKALCGFTLFSRKVQGNYIRSVVPFLYIDF
jgi:hypothetical protein